MFLRSLPTVGPHPTGVIQSAAVSAATAYTRVPTSRTASEKLGRGVPQWGRKKGANTVPSLPTTRDNFLTADLFRRGSEAFELASPTIDNGPREKEENLRNTPPASGALKGRFLCVPTASSPLSPESLLHSRVQTSLVKIRGKMEDVNTTDLFCQRR